MKKHLQNTLFGLSISLILSVFAVNADTSKTTTSKVEYRYYAYGFHEQMYYRFLPAPSPEGLFYHTRIQASANIDDTPKREVIALIVAGTEVDGLRDDWVQAFLLIAENEAGQPKKKDLFKLFDTRMDPLDVSTKSIELHNAPLVFTEPTDVSFRLVDLTGDGILDIWVKSADGVVVISFQNGEFKAVCSVHSSFQREDPIEYIDLDNDGIYEIKIPTRISIDGVPGAAKLPWMSLYEWDGTTYISNNERFYTENDDFLIRLLDQYNFWRRFTRIEEVYSFYIGLAYYYRGNLPMVRKYLQWVVKNAETQDYIQAAESILKKLPDVTGDGVVNILDLVAVANAFGEAEPDLNGDGVVNIQDLVIVANAFNN